MLLAHLRYGQIVLLRSALLYLWVCGGLFIIVLKTGLREVKPCGLETVILINASCNPRIWSAAST